MSTLEIWAMAVGLAMDCMAVSVASGVILKHFRGRTMFSMALSFGFFQAIMPLAGWFFFRLFSHYVETFDHWIAFSILLFLGIRMVRASKSENEEANFDPTKRKTILALSVATSIDALVIGVSFACLGIENCSEIMAPVGIIGLVSFLFSLTGLSLGILFGKRYNFKAELLGGLILIGIGIKVLFEHLYV